MANPQSSWKAVSLVSLIGTNLVICTLLGVWLGRRLDEQWGTAPWMLVMGVLLGMAVGVLVTIPVMKRFLGD
ncbi:AtpZ/AtpI family protein [Ammoniphilus sp. YIM 78166]|uniref:AtpZ/AtpI family protein n=1 Tax=Ammoniphilus sp. YIM 78166 TaxID=1644106 RepID=UPI00107015E8|nr:AtpZ/AtpI family protein [Ammoniphilus sp. YIM 78166]